VGRKSVRLAKAAQDCRTPRRCRVDERPTANAGCRPPATGRFIASLRRACPESVEGISQHAIDVMPSTVLEADDAQSALCSDYVPTKQTVAIASGNGKESPPLSKRSVSGITRTPLLQPKSGNHLDQNGGKRQFFQKTAYRDESKLREPCFTILLTNVSFFSLPHIQGSRSITVQTLRLNPLSSAAGPRTTPPRCMSHRARTSAGPWRGR